MSLPIRILDTDLRSARWNVAMTAALVERHASALGQDTVRFHRYAASVLIGRSQDVGRVADVDYCQHAGIEIARRVTGGGAVFMSPRMLAWEVLTDRGALGADLEAATRRICEGVAAGLSRLGVSARFRGPNDIEVGGRKVSGSSGYIDGRSAVLQGTVLITDDLPEMARALRISETVLRQRLSCLTAAVGRALPIADVADSVLRGLMRALDRTAAMAQPSAAEIAAAEAMLREEIGTEEFVTGIGTAHLAEDAAWHAGS